ncbi:MAG: hypothetical protein J07HX64_02344 [halophilic archaeon J07HX64]|jgi:hypothetical protein|nr:MAG: hypothetical protein J07HX64_02344 [halophilic archaeon J07HX64]
MRSNGGHSPFERLKQYYNHEERVCQECGFEDRYGTWDAETDGSDIAYTHTCPRCGAEQEHTLELSNHDTRHVLNESRERRLHQRDQSLSV